MNAKEISARLRSLGDERIAQGSRRFFKTGPGEYGEGDLFIGVRVPELRRFAREYQSVSTGEVAQLLSSAVHEERLLALLLLVRIYERGDAALRECVYHLYLDSTRFVNNWDLVDSSAPQIVGGYLCERSRRPLYALAESPKLWERRIAIIATFHFIRRGEFSDTLGLAELLLRDEEDLIHKAIGWMLREVGKRDLASEEGFLREHHKMMPRTMLRYAIEKLPEAKRQKYLKA
ncbi:MAG: DNA alkylation repair protein [Rubrivivax sp.]|nr:DNA alkylation repair protein [Pyrinomonadaceae bacterium]